jgi:phosphohistidine phosphatase
MNRTLVLIRHAKAAWANPLQSDYDRTLNERGILDAPEMGAWLKKSGTLPDLIVASAAKRTAQTAKYIANAIGYDIGKIQWEEKLYHCIPSVFEEVICEVSDDVKSLFIVAHNPGITEFVNELAPLFKIDNVPTCGVVAVAVETDMWQRFPLAERKVILYHYPGNI